MNVGQRLRQQRKRVGLTLGQVAQYEGVTVQYLSDLERGRNDPRVWSLISRLANRYHTSVDYLLSLTDDPSPIAARQGDPPDLIELSVLLRQLPPARRREVRAIVETLMELDDESRLSLDEAIDQATGRAPHEPRVVE